MKIMGNSKRSCLSGAACMAIATAAMTAGGPAWAQPAEQAAASEPQSQIGDIIVTAQRREESLQKVPVSVTAIGGAALTERAIVDSTDITKMVPALKYNAYSPSTTVYNLRGVSQNDYSDQLEPPVAVYLDDSYMSSMTAAGFPLFDIERVEVLRGPQGTLFGRNATGGAMQFISRKPSQEMSINSSATWFSDGGYSFEAGVGGGVTDTLAVRAAVSRVQRDGFLNDTNPLVRAHGATDQFAGRVQLLWKPTSNVKVALRAMRSKDDNASAGGTYSYAPAVPTDHGRGVYQLPTQDYWGTGPGKDPGGYSKPANLGLFTITSDTPSNFNRTIQAYTGRVDVDLGNVTLISITDYQRIFKNYIEDCDGSPVHDCVFSPTTHIQQFSQELRAEGRSGPLQWVVGGNYINIRGHYQSHAEYNLVSLGYFSTGDSNYRITTHSPSAFFQGAYDLTDKLKITAGFRYTRDNKKDNYQLNFAEDLGDGNGPTNYQVLFNPALQPSLARRRDNLYSGKLQLDYSPTSNLLLYAGVTRGTKGGNFSAPVSINTGVPISNVTDKLSHAPETLWDYEAGFKSKFLDNRVVLNGSAFYYDYRGYQTFALIDLVQTISNHNAWVYGGELELTAIPVEGLNISGGISYLKSRVHDVSLPDGTIVDSKLPQAPRFSGNASISYTLPLDDRSDLTARLDGTFTSGFCFSVVCAPIERESAYQTLDASIAYRMGDFTLTGFVKNLTNEHYRTYALDVAALGVAENIYARPRFYGVSLAVNVK